MVDLGLDRTEGEVEISFPAIRVRQPIGDFFIGSIDSKTLCDITYFDVRRIVEKKRPLEDYLGIQRPVNPKRIKEIQAYVQTKDACFPTAVVLAVEGRCAEYDEETCRMTLRNIIEPADGEDPIYYKTIARVLDGQHRIEGLRNFEEGDQFQINISVFVDADIADQAYLFSTVNLAQTKVSKSLVYDLFGLAKARSPQKLAHNIVVALDRTENSPFYMRIKRLGGATKGRYGETITQATFVEMILRYICKDNIQQIADRNTYLKGRVPNKVDADDLKKLIFRNMFIDEKDIEITDILMRYFNAVNKRWPEAWETNAQGMVLNRTNGFKALMRFLRPAYWHIAGPGDVPKEEQFFEIFDRMQIEDKDFDSANFRPGTSGESDLYQRFMMESNLEG